LVELLFLIFSWEDFLGLEFLAEVRLFSVWHPIGARNKAVVGLAGCKKTASHTDMEIVSTMLTKRAKRDLFFDLLVAFPTFHVSLLPTGTLSLVSLSATLTG
jgi:hypothetical protein